MAYSYLNASTGLSFEARQAGYRAKMTLTPMPKPNASTNTSGDRMGVMDKSPPPPPPPISQAPPTKDSCHDVG